MTLLNQMANDEMRFVSNLAQLFNTENIKINKQLNKGIINFVLMRKEFLIHKKHGSKRVSENDLNFRIITIERIAKQIERDKGHFDAPYNHDFLEIQILIALTEKACLISETKNKQDVRDTLALDFHLWAFRKILTQQKVNKPVEVIASVFERSGVLKGLGGSWQAHTIKNKLTKVQTFIERSKALGACHEPEVISQWHRVSSPLFIKELGQNCTKCMKIWSKLLNAKTDQVSPMDMSAQYLAKKLPKHSKLIKKIVHSLETESIGEGMPLEKILERFPEKSMAIFPELFNI